MRARGGGPPSGGWSLVAVFAGLQALAFGDRFLLALLAAPISRGLAVDDLHIGLLQGVAFVVPFVLFTPVFGVLTDRWPRRLPVVAGLALSTAAVAWSAAADGFGSLLGARMLLGVGEAAIAPAALVQIATATPAGRAGLATALFAAGGPLGKGLALAGGGLLLGLFARHGGPLPPWREVLLVAAGVNALAAAVAWRALAAPPARGAGAEPPRAQAQAGAQGPGGGAAALAAVAAGGVAVVFASQTVAAWAPSLFARSFSLAAGRAGVMAGAPLLTVGPACGLAGGWLIDRARGRPDGRGGGASAAVRMLAASLAAVAALALALRAAPDAAWAEVAFSLLAGALGGGAVAGLRGVQIYAPAASRGRVAALYVAAANLVAFGIGPPLVGWLSDPRAHGDGGLAGALTLVVASVSAAGCLVVVGGSTLATLPWAAGAARGPSPASERGREADA